MLHQHGTAEDKKIAILKGRINWSSLSDSDKVSVTALLPDVHAATARLIELGVLEREQP